MTNLVKSVSRKSFFREYVQSLDGVLVLRPCEKRILARLIEFQIRENKLGNPEKDIARRENRAILRKELMMSPGNLSKYMIAMTNNNVLRRRLDGRSLYVNPIIMPQLEDGKAEIKITIQIKDDTKVP